MYPAGYCGSYVNWAISVSDKDLSSTTVKNPINGDAGTQYGGAGTSHKHIRVPTHQGIAYHTAWVMQNKELAAKPRIYIINSAGTALYSTVWNIAMYDPTGVFIQINHNDELNIKSFGTINCVTKWPSYMAATLAGSPNEDGANKIHATFDPFDCANDILFRNWVIQDSGSFFRQNKKFNDELMNQFVNRYNKTFLIRNKYQPHEFNETMYLSEINLTNRVFSLSCLDVCQSNFPNWLAEFMQVSKVSDNYNCDHIEGFHKNYIDSQPNLQWFTSIQNWELSGEIDDYLMSHSIIQAQVIENILHRSGIMKLTITERDAWVNAYSSIRTESWPALNIDEHCYYDLPISIQSELVNAGYKTHIPYPPNKVMLTLDWQNLSLHEINEVYQRSKT